MSGSVNDNTNANRSPLLSPTASTLSPTWRPPKSPLPPHRLAKLANALGVSTPIPAGQSPTTYFSRSFQDVSSPIDMRRSPTPSTAASSMSFSSFQPSTSKFLLHVIPPMHLPHDSDNPDDSRVPPPPNTPGYHTQFRRGTLVPVHATLQAQLGAIAKEYALPSVSGLILYLVSQQTDGMDEPGPRLSEDIWKHLWTRVVRSEQRDDILLPSLSPRSATPQTPRTPLGLAPATRSTPSLPQENSSGPLRPFLSISGDQPQQPYSPQAMYPLTTAPSPSTASSISDIRSTNKSAPPSSSTSVSQSQSEDGPDTPDTSVDSSGLRANFLDLPGLNSPSLIPILAKVEFDIDRRKAAWYEPWVRSRKANHAKRAESRKGSRNASNDELQQVREHVPIELLTGKKNRLDPFGLLTAEPEEARRVLDDNEDEAEELEKEDGEDGSGGYARLSESPEEVNSDSDSDSEEFVEENTARVTSLPGGKDPLDDVFGTDADTWADIRAESGERNKHLNPNVVDLALTAEELDALPSPTQLEEQERDDDDDDTKSTKEEDDVIEMLDRMGNPTLAMNIPSPEKNVSKRSSSPTSGGSGRKIPPPLVLKTKDKPAAVTSPALADNARLAYLGEGEFPDHEEQDTSLEETYTRIRSPTESDKRGGAVFDDLDLGLDPTEDFDEDDPNDRRRSQYLMRAQLDEIEKTMAQLSPRILKVDLEEEQNMSFGSAGLSPRSPGNVSLSPGSLRNSDYFPPSSPRLPRHPDPPENPMYYAGETWPAVPFAAIKDRESNPAANPNAPPSPPRLAVNGVTTSAPRSYMPSRVVASGGPSESERRKKMEDEQAPLYPAAAAPASSSSLSLSTSALNNNSINAESPVIPLSPDPFGRHPSSPEPFQNVQMSGAQWDTMTIGKGNLQPSSSSPEPGAQQPPIPGRVRSSTTTSRFSADSLKGEDAAALASVSAAAGPVVTAAKTQNRATLMSVKSIKKLWRKSNNKSQGGSSSSSTAVVPALPTPTPTPMSSGRSSPMVPQRPERPSEEQLDLPDVPDLPAGFGGSRMSAQSVQGGNPNGNVNINVGANVGRLSPQPPVQLPPRTDSMQGSQRPSFDQHRPSLEQVGRPGQQQQQQQQQLQPQQQSQQQRQQQQFQFQQQQQQLQLQQQQQYQQYQQQQQQNNFQQLSVPSYPGRNPNPGPIITPHMQAAKAVSGLDRLHFDQESPYPTRRSPTMRQSPRPPSPPPLPAIPEQEKNIARKSILRWKSAAASTTAGSAPAPQPDPQPRSSFERPGAHPSARGRRPSVVNFGSTRASATSPDLLPPSPQIPTQFMPAKNGLDHRGSQRSRLTTSSTDSSYSPPKRQASLLSQSSSLGARSYSPPRSMASSRDSQGSRPSFDASQFEFVSPKAGTLSYPYNSLDH